MNLLHPEECLDLGSELEANSTIEICTGKKKAFPHILKFKMHKGGTITPLQDKLNYMGIKNRKYDFYLGGTDSCQGKQNSVQFSSIHHIDNHLEVFLVSSILHVGHGQEP